MKKLLLFLVVILFSCEKEAPTQDEQCQLTYKNNYNYVCDLRDNGIIDSIEFSVLSARCTEQYNQCKSN